MTISQKSIPLTFDVLPKKFIDELSEDPKRFKDLELDYQNNERVVIDLIDRKINIATCLSIQMTNNPFVITKVLLTFPEMKKNAAFMRSVIKANVTFTALVKPSLLKNRDFLREILTDNPKVADVLPPAIKSDLNFPLILAQVQSTTNSVSPPVVRKASLRKSISLPKSPINPVNQATSEQI